jgi:hypothetical protein
VAMESVGAEPRTDQLPPAVKPRLNVGVVVATDCTAPAPLPYNKLPDVNVV